MMERIVLDTNCLIMAISSKSSYHKYGIALFQVVTNYVSVMKF